MPKFTGGIWSVILYEDSNNYIIKSIEGIIAKIPRNVPLAYEQHAADARLICEAPRMYELLEKCLVSCPFISKTQKELRQKYVSWCKDAGHEPQSRNKFIQSFRKTIKQLLPFAREITVMGVRCFDFSKIRPISDFFDEDHDKVC